MLLGISLSFAWAFSWDLPLLKLENQATEIKEESKLIKEIVSSIKQGRRVEKIPELLQSIDTLDRKIQKSQEIFKNIEID